MFYSEENYDFFLNVLREAKLRYPCFIYSYCLMTNHFHLLVEPKEKENLSLLIKLVGAKYVRYVNKNYRRTGTLWEGRFKSCLIDEKQYFLT
ncbi:MAG: transposase, partial [Planctomycetota bacterium]